MFTNTGASICHPNTFGGRSDDGESSGVPICLAEVVAVSTESYVSIGESLLGLK